MKVELSVLLILATAISGGLTRTHPDDAIADIGRNRQLFLDSRWLQKASGVERRLHEPVRREVVIRADGPADRGGVSYSVVFRDGEKFRMWYRADPADSNQDAGSRTAYAESQDGIHWRKPKLGIVSIDGSSSNNLVWPSSGQPGRNLCVFKDERPGVTGDELYKATGWEPQSYFDKGAKRGLCMVALVSPDGLHWRQIRENPIYVPDVPALDSHNQTFWDPWQEQYVGYWRIFVGSVRSVMRTTSADFRKWSKPEIVPLDLNVHEQFYTTSAIPYLRAPRTYVMFPSRYVADRNLYTPSTPGRPPTNTQIDQGVNDIALLSSRDGVHWDWSLREAFVRPGLDPRTWYDRSLYLDRGILQTTPEEMSLFVMENLRTDDVHIRRVTLRTDGFVSVHAGSGGGEFTTPPLRFEGKRLELNYATSAVGLVKVEIQDEAGKPISEFSERESKEIFGDHIERQVVWGGRLADLTSLANRVVRLRFVLRDADLYAFRFAE